MMKRDPTTLEKLKYLGDFVSDGCSLAPDLVFFDCCEQHDLDYSTNVKRATADKKLCLCIRDTGHPVLARIYWIGVRLGGWWGYYFGPSAEKRREYITNLEMYNRIFDTDK